MPWWQPPKGTPSARPDAAGWTCPRCGRTYKNKSQAHSCETLTVADFFAGRPEALRLYRDVERWLRGVGPFRVHAQRTRIAFIATMSFAGIPASGRDWVDFGFLLRRPVAEPRLVEHLALPGKWYGYKLRVTAPGQLAEASGWLRPLVEESYAIGTNEAYR